MPLGYDQAQDPNAIRPMASPIDQVAKVAGAYSRLQSDAQMRQAALNLMSRDAIGVTRVPKQSHWWGRHDGDLDRALFVPQLQGEDPSDAASQVNKATRSLYAQRIRSQQEGLRPLLTPRATPPGYGDSESPLTLASAGEEHLPRGAETLLMPSDKDTGFQRVGPYSLGTSLPELQGEYARRSASRAEIALRRIGAEISPSADGESVDIILPQNAPDEMRQEVMDSLRRLRQDIGETGPKFRVRRGQPEPQDFGVLSSLKRAWGAGQNMVELGDISFKSMFRDLSDKEQERLESLRMGMEPGVEAEGWFEKGWVEWWRMAPLQARTLLSGLKGAAPGAAAGAGTALALGQLGPQVGLPEEAVTVPGAAWFGGKTGFIAGSGLAVMKLEAGLAYDEIREFTDEQGEKIDPATARAAAVGVGIANAALEFAALRTLIKNMPGGSALLSKFSREGVKELLKNRTMRQSLARLGKGMAETMTAETLTEIAQEISNIVGGEIAKRTSGQPFEETPGLGLGSMESMERLQEIGVATAQAMTFGGAIGPGARFIHEQGTRATRAAFPTREPRRLGGSGDPSPTRQGGVATPDAALQIPSFTFPDMPATLDGPPVHENPAIQERLQRARAILPMLENPQHADRLVQGITRIAQDQAVWEEQIAAARPRVPGRVATMTTGEVNKQAKSRADAIKRTLDAMLLLADKDTTEASALLGAPVDALIFSGQIAGQSPATVEAKAALAEWAYGVSQAAAERRIALPTLPPLAPEQIDDIGVMATRVADAAQAVQQQDIQAPVGAPAPLRDYEPGDAVSPRVQITAPETGTDEVFASTAREAPVAADYRDTPLVAAAREKSISNRLSHGTSFLAGHFVASNPRALTSVEQDSVPVMVHGGRTFVTRPDGPIEITDDLRRADLYREIPTRGGVLKPGWEFVPARTAPVAYKLEDDNLLIDPDETTKRSWAQRAIANHIIENSGEVDMTANPMEDPGSLGLMFINDPPTKINEVDNLIGIARAMRTELRRRPLPTAKQALREVEAAEDHDYEGGVVNKAARVQEVHRDRLQERLALEGLIDAIEARMLQHKQSLFAQEQAQERQLAYSVDSTNERNIQQPRVLAHPGMVEQYVDGIKAYHGTPHRGIRKFDLQKIGSGEGAQVYGWGLYFAQAQDTAETYRENLSGPSINEIEVNLGGESIGTLDGFIDPVSGRMAYQWRFDPAELNGFESSELVQILDSDTFKNLLYNLPGGLGRVNSAFQQALYDAASHWKRQAERVLTEANRTEDPQKSEQLRRKGRSYQRKWEILNSLEEKNLTIDGISEEQGQTYEVHLPNVEAYLDWDKTLSEQPEILKKIQQTPSLQLSPVFTVEDMTGAQYYAALAQKFADDAGVPTDEYNAHRKAASLALRDAGIPGLKYLDALSRRREEMGGYEEDHTRNYVVFDENQIRDITEYYPRRRAVDNVRRIDMAEADGLLDAGSAALLRHFLTLDPTFNETDALEVLDVVVKATPEILVDEGVPPEQAIQYHVTGSTISEAADGVMQTTIRLYHGAHPGTVVEEWYHRSWNRMSLHDREIFRRYHEQSEDPRSIEEHFAQEGRDWFFSEGLHEQAEGWGILDLFARARNSLLRLVGRLKALRNGPPIPEEIERLYARSYRGVPGLMNKESQQLFDNWFKRSVVRERDVGEQKATYVDPFEELAHLQRGVPESAMLKFQMHSAGMHSWLMEHAGDLIHRMTEMPDFLKGGYDAVKEKVDKIHFNLFVHEQGGMRLEDEIQENARNNTRDMSPKEAAEWHKKGARLRSAYAKAHRSLPTYNRIQRKANQLAINIASEDWKGAREAITELKQEIDKGPEHWSKVAMENYTPPPKPAEVGAPKMVFHGTARAWNPSPDQPFIPSGGGPHAGLHFSEDPKVASEFAGPTVPGRQPRIYGAYLSIQKPADIPDTGTAWELSDKNPEELAAQLGISTDRLMEALVEVNRKKGVRRGPQERQNFMQLARTATLSGLLQELGYDGIRYTNRNYSEMMASLRSLGITQAKLQERFLEHFLDFAIFDGEVNFKSRGRRIVFRMADGWNISLSTESSQELAKARSTDEAKAIYESLPQHQRMLILDFLSHEFLQNMPESSYRELLPELPLNYIIFDGGQAKSAHSNQGVWNRRSKKMSFSVEPNDPVNPDEAIDRLNQLAQEWLNIESQARRLRAQRKKVPADLVKRLGEIAKEGQALVSRAHEAGGPASFGGIVEAQRQADFESRKKRHFADGLGFSSRTGREIWNSLDDYGKFMGMLHRIMSPGVTTIKHLDRVNPTRAPKYWGDWRPDSTPGSARNPDKPNQSQLEALLEAYITRRKKMEQDQKDVATIRALARQKGNYAGEAIARRIPPERLLQLSVHEVDRMLRDEPGAFEALEQALLNQRGVDDANEFISSMDTEEQIRAKQHFAVLQQKLQGAFDETARKNGLALEKEVRTRDERNRLTLGTLITRTQQALGGLGQMAAAFGGRPSLVLGWRKQAPNAAALLKYIDAGDFDRSIFKILYEADLARHEANRDALQGKFQPLIEAAAEDKELDARIFRYLDKNVALDQIPETYETTIRGRKATINLRQMVSDLREFYDDVISKAEEARMAEIVQKMGEQKAAINEQLVEMERREVEMAQMLGYNVQTRADIANIKGLQRKLGEGLQADEGNPGAEPGSFGRLPYRTLKSNTDRLKKKYRELKAERDGIAQGGMRRTNGYVTHIHRLAHETIADKMQRGVSDVEIINLHPKDRDRFLQPRQQSNPIPSWVVGFFLYTPAMHEYVYLDSAKNAVWPMINQIENDIVRNYAKEWVSSLKGQPGDMDSKMNQLLSSVLHRKAIEEMKKKGKSNEEIAKLLEAHGLRPATKAIYNVAKFNYYTMLSPVRIGFLSLLEMGFMAREIMQNAGNPKEAMLLLADAFVGAPFRATRELLNEYRTYLGNRRDPLRAREFSEATRMGVTDTIHEMMAEHGLAELERHVLKGEPGMVRKAIRKIGSAWAFSMRMAELFLRSSTYQALKGHGQAVGMTEEQAKTYAAVTTNDLIGAYNKRDTAPKIARSSLGRPLIFLSRFVLNKTELVAADGIFSLTRGSGRSLGKLTGQKRQPPTSGDPEFGQWEPAERNAYERSGDPAGRFGIDQDMLSGMQKWHAAGVAGLGLGMAIVYKALEPIFGSDFAARYAWVFLGRAESGLGAFTRFISDAFEIGAGASIYMTRVMTGAHDGKPTRMERQAMKKFKQLRYAMPYFGATIRDIQNIQERQKQGMFKTDEFQLEGSEEFQTEELELE